LKRARAISSLSGLLRFHAQAKKWTPSPETLGLCWLYGLAVVSWAGRGLCGPIASNSVRANG
jgi:hypothetical protein